MELLADYQNGNIRTQMYSDGTKVREYEGTPKPVHPESIDLKITDWCDAGCTFCHENSTVRGKHASLDSILSMVDGLPAGVELAIGGGDPLSHPKIHQILDEFWKRGLVSNITVNGLHIYRHFDTIQRLRMAAMKHSELPGLLHMINGVGISFADSMWTDYADVNEQYDILGGRFREFSDIADENTIIHFIAGEHQPSEVINAMQYHPKILVLGYKNFGRGIKNFGPRTDHLLSAWRYWIGTIMRMGSVCFDNLALEQLKIKDRIPADTWNRCYMGGDGTFTMYADAVKQEYAVSSTSLRFPKFGLTAREFFVNLTNSSSMTK